MRPLPDRIAEILPRLTPAERKVAELVAADPASLPQSTVAGLAKAAGVSDPTVIRFCRSLGLDGFAELRMEAVRSSGSTPAAPRPITAETPAPQAGAAVLEIAIAALTAARATLDGEAMTRAALALLRAARVEIWASGAAFAAARHLEQALMGLCRGVVARDDGALQGLAAATLEGDSVALCLSRGGAERELVEAARLAAAAGATVIAVTRARSPLAATSQVLLACEMPEGGAPGNPGGILQLAMAEALAATAALMAPPLPAPRAERLAAARRLRRIES